MAPSFAIQDDATPDLTVPKPPSSLTPVPTTTTSATMIAPLPTPTSTPDSTPWSPSTVLSTFPAHSQPQPYTSSPVPFFHILTRLKTTKREGWRRFGLMHGESIADHMYRMSIMCLCAPTGLAGRLDRDRCMRLALVHDMAELLVGDITPVDGVPKVEKNRRESAAMDYLCQELLGDVDGGAQGRDLRQAWQEYEDGVTPEAMFVKDVDKYELVLQMLEYEREGEGKLELGEFTRVARHIVSPEVRAWCEQTLKEREQFWKEHVGRAPNSIAGNEKTTTEQQDQYYA